MIVHLPIGFILMALLLMYYPKKDKLPFLPAIEIALLWSCISAFLACISGFLLYTSEGYAFETVQNHLILGLVTALICLLLRTWRPPLYVDASGTHMKTEDGFPPTNTHTQPGIRPGSSPERH